jgi:hypothetical protein
MAKFKTGSIYQVEFWDHAHHTGSTSGPLMCRVWGQVIAQDELAIELAAWLCLDDVHGLNKESFAVLKSTVVKAKLLK